MIMIKGETILKYNNILVAIDGSDASEKAFQKAVEMTKQNDAQIILTHVVDSRTFATAEAYDRTLAERAEEYATETLDRFVDEAKKAGIENVKRVIEYGSPKVKIAKDIAQDNDVDLIVCGATGLNAVERFLIGSVSENIVRQSKCDVLVVR